MIKKDSTYLICIALLVFAVATVLPAGAQTSLAQADNIEPGQVEVAEFLKILHETFYQPLTYNKLLASYREGINEYLKTKGLEPLDTGNEETDDIDALKKFHQLVEKSEINYQERTEAIYGGISRVLDSINDPSAKFFLPGQYRKSLSEMGYNKGGGGFFADEEPDDEGRFVVIETLKDFPAAKEGLQSGDRIIKIDNKPMQGKTFKELANAVRGPVGSNVVITVFRPDENKTVDIPIKRTWLGPNPNSLKADKLDDATGYIKFRFLGERILFELQKIYITFDDENIRVVIWDFRNSAGSVDGGLQLGEELAPEDTVFISRVYKDYTETYTGKGENGPPFGKPLVILINRHSSAACTIVALALRNLDGVRLIGEPAKWNNDLTHVHEFQDGSVARFSNGYYMTGKKEKLMQDDLISPDVSIKQPSVPPLGPDGDIQLKTAMEYLKKEYKDYIKN